MQSEQAIKELIEKILLHPKISLNTKRIMQAYTLWILDDKKSFQEITTKVLKEIENNE